MALESVVSMACLGGTRSLDIHGFGFGVDHDNHHEEKGYAQHDTFKHGDIIGSNLSGYSPPETYTENFNFHKVFSSPNVATGRRKRRRTRNAKDKEEVESQRITHIAVERNRRKLMNDYLAELRSMMPPFYSQRGDQASIVGGAINFVKELEQLLQSLEARRRINKQSNHLDLASTFSNFFTFPQYSTSSNHKNNTHGEYMNPHVIMGYKQLEANADVEVTMVESHANIKVLLKKHPKQLLKMVLGLHSLRLVILHLNVTSMDAMILYSFTVKVEDNAQLTSMNGIATDVYELVGRIQEDNEFFPQ